MRKVFKNDSLITGIKPKRLRVSRKTQCPSDECTSVVTSLNQHVIRVMVQRFFRLKIILKTNAVIFTLNYSNCPYYAIVNLSSDATVYSASDAIVHSASDDPAIVNHAVLSTFYLANYKVLKLPLQLATSIHDENSSVLLILINTCKYKKNHVDSTKF